jgi:Uma2 family endonuclease
MVATTVDFERFALDHVGQKWELHRGRPREKPPMAGAHGLAIQDLPYQPIEQLDKSKDVVRTGYGHVARATTSYYLPDVFVVPASVQESIRRQPRLFEVYRDPLPLVVEVWSPGTGAYDIDEKLPEYMARGDHEIWRIHPSARTLTAWRRRPDGGYEESVHTGGTIAPLAVPGVVIDLGALVAR